VAESGVSLLLWPKFCFSSAHTKFFEDTNTFGKVVSCLIGLEGVIMRYKRLNSLNILFFVPIIFFFCGFNVLQIRAAEQRHHKAHVHGVAHINVALEDNALYIEFTSPAANIVGFEHQPKTEEQKIAVNEAIETLKAGEKLFVMPPSAGASLMKSDVDAGIEIDTEHESGDRHKHEPSDHHGEKQKHNKEHYKEDEHEQHSEFKAVYQFACKNPDKLSHMDVMLFRIFKGIDHIEVQILTPKKQTSIELNAKRNRIAF
jgi:hypothetical protein